MWIKILFTFILRFIKDEISLKFLTIKIFIYKITNKKIEVNAVKGVELPINILVVVAIAVIVLLGLVALYFMGFGPFSKAAGVEAVKSQGCNDLNPRAGCVTDPNTILVNYDVDGDGVIAVAQDNLQTFAAKYYACAADIACTKRMCSCPGY